MPSNFDKRNDDGTTIFKLFRTAVVKLGTAVPTFIEARFKVCKKKNKYFPL